MMSKHIIVTISRTIRDSSRTHRGGVTCAYRFDVRVILGAISWTALQGQKRKSGRWFSTILSHTEEEGRVRETNVLIIANKKLDLGRRSIESAPAFGK